MKGGREGGREEGRERGGDRERGRKRERVYVCAYLLDLYVPRRLHAAMEMA